MVPTNRHIARSVTLAAGAALLLTACGGAVAQAPSSGSEVDSVADAAASGTAGRASETASGGIEQVSSDSGPPGRQLPRLTEISVRHGNTYSTVTLRFAPGEGTPKASVEEVDDATLTKPGSGKKVTLSGDQALDVSVAPAIVGDVQPFTGNNPTFTEVRVLGFFEGRTNIGIGIKGEGDLAPKVSKPNEHTIRIAVPIPPYDPGAPGKKHCGDVAFEANSDVGVFGITASGVGCDVARSVAAKAEGNMGQPYTTESGFTCDPEWDNSGPTPETIYTCTRGGATITFNT